MDSFEIPIEHKGKELLFPAEVIRHGYVHRIQVDVDGQIIFLEKDEEGSYRAIANGSNTKELDKGIVEAIVSSVETILK